MERGGDEEGRGIKTWLLDGSGGRRGVGCVTDLLGEGIREGGSS